MCVDVDVGGEVDRYLYVISWILGWWWGVDVWWGRVCCV